MEISRKLFKLIFILTYKGLPTMRCFNERRPEHDLAQFAVARREPKRAKHTCFYVLHVYIE